MKLLKNRILIKPITEAKKTASGLIIPNKVNAIKIGEVLITGIKTEVVKVGDKVQHDFHSGIPYTHENMECLIITEDNVLAIL